MAERSKRSSKGKSISFVVVLLRDDGSTHPEYNITVDDSKRRLFFFLHYDHMHFFPKPKYSLLYYLKRVALRRKADILRLSFNWNFFPIFPFFYPLDGVYLLMIHERDNEWVQGPDGPASSQIIRLQQRCICFDHELKWWTCDDEKLQQVVHCLEIALCKNGKK